MSFFVTYNYEEESMESDKGHSKIILCQDY